VLDRECYLSELAARRRKSRAYTRHQLMGLLIAELLGDRTHKSLYIKMAKEGNPDVLMSLAKDVADRPNIDNRGAYFMAAAHERGLIPFTHPEDASNLPAR
jgi:hypothetical protein